MTGDRFFTLSGHWVKRASEAARDKDNPALTIALIAHGMCCAAYLGAILSYALDPDPPLPSKVRR